MQVLKSLTATAQESPFQAPMGVRAAVLDQPRPGVLRTVQLTDAGLIFTRAKVRVAIPLAELLALAETAVPAFAAQQPAVEQAPDASTATESL